jgi:putative redox protein
MNELAVMLERTGATATTTDIRGHQVTIDRPEAGGGSNAGPMGGELFLTSIGGCFMSTFIAAARARNVDAESAVCKVTGTFADNPRRFGDVKLDVSCDSCSPDELAHLVLLAEKGCLVLNTLRGGLSVTVSTAARLNA